MRQRIAEEHDFEELYDAIFALGTNFLHQGKFDKALIIFDGLLALEPSERRAALAYGETLLVANRAERALNHFFSLSQQFDVDGRTLILTAKACVLLDKPDEAKKFLSMITNQEIVASNQDAEAAQAILSLL